MGRTLAGRYRIVRRLGRGAMGAVYLGEHLRFGRMDAIKVLQSSMARDEEATRRFLRGARNASAINHRNVCTVYDFSDTDEGLQFLAMEFVEGETLADLLEREGALPPQRARSIVSQVAGALQAAHDLDIVHRDLKPGNVMLTRERDGSDLVKVVDFDIAKGSREGEGTEVTRLGFVVGTPEYMSPEQLTGDPLDGRSDVYSLGLLFFRLLTGELPMRSTSTQELLVERLTQDPLTLREVAPERDIPPHFQAVLDRALQRRREDRYASALDFARDLEAAAPAPEAPRRSATLEAPASPRVGGTPSRPSGEEVPATRISDAGPLPAGDSAPPAGRSDDGARTRRLLTWGLGGAALVAVSLVGYLVIQGGQPGTVAGPGENDIPIRPHTPPGEDTGGVVTPGGMTGGNTAVADSAGPPPGGGGGNAGRASGGGGGGERTAGGGGEEGGGGPPPPFRPADAEDVAFRQLDRLSDPEPSALQAAMDTALMVIEMESAPASARAVAGYILGEANVTRGDTAAAIDWLERALQLDPSQQGPQTLLRQLRGGAP